MKNLNLYIVVFLSITLYSFTVDFGAPTAKKLTGKWESVFRLGDDNCEKDVIINFELDGKATMIGGSRHSECKGSSFEVSSWTVTKTERSIKAQTNAKNTIVLNDDGDEINILVAEFVGDYMKIYMEVVSGDTTAPKGFIMKKVE